MFSPNYNPSHHLHEIFSDPDSLNELSSLLLYINDSKHRVAREVHEGISRFDATKAPDIYADTQEMLTLLKSTKADASNTKEVIHEMTSSIQVLDNGKKNLVLSMTILKRLQMLVNAYSTLAEAALTHNYKEIFQDLSVVKGFLAFFTPYKAIEEINQIYLTIQNIQNKLVKDIQLDFEDLTSSNGRGAKQDRTQLQFGCRILELIDLKLKDDLLSAFFASQLTDINSIFSDFGEAGSLDNLNRRYTYYKNTLALIRQQYMQNFPSEWKIDTAITKVFCQKTSQSLSKLLSSKPCSPALISDSLSFTLEFEKYLVETLNDPSFNHTLSVVFEPYLLVWVKDQEKGLRDLMREFAGMSQIPPELKDADDLAVFLKSNNIPNIAVSSPELFKAFQKILTNLLKMSNGEVLTNLCRLFLTFLLEFHNRILAPIASANIERDFTVPGDKLGKSNFMEPLKYLTMLLNSADYVLSNIDDLQERFHKSIKPQFEEDLPSFDSVRDAYYKLITKSISSLLFKVSHDLKPCWRQLANYNWNSIDSALSVSGYMEDTKLIVGDNIRVILPLIIRDSYARNFCDKLVECLVHAIGSTLKSVKPLDEKSITQIQHDIDSLKQFALLFLSYSDANYVEDPSHATLTVSKPYERYVLSQFSHLQNLLSLLLSPTDPVDQFIEKYFELIGDKLLTNFGNVLQLIGGVDSTRCLARFIAKVDATDLTLADLQPFLACLDEVAEPTMRPTKNDSKQQKTTGKPINNLERNLRDFAWNGENQVNKLNENFRNFGKLFRKDND